MTTCTLRYRPTPDADWTTYTYDAERQWDIIARADAKFANAAERADEPERYRRAIELQRKAGVRK